MEQSTSTPLSILVRDYDGSTSFGLWLASLISALRISEATLAVELRVHPMVIRELILDQRVLYKPMSEKLEQYIGAPSGLIANMQARRSIWLHQQTPEYLEACRRWNPIDSANLDELITHMKGSGIRRLSPP